MADSRTPITLSSEKTGTAGTPTKLAAATVKCASATVIAKSGNTGQVYIGGSTVDNTVNDGLAPGDALEIPAGGKPWFDLADFYLDVDTTGEGVDIYAVTA